MPVYSADDFIGKTLYARKKTNVYVSTEEGAKPLATIQPGQIIGTVDTYVGGKGNGPVWFSFLRPGRTRGQVGAMYYVKMGDNNIDTKTLQEQGLKSTEQKAKEKEEAEQSTADKLIDLAKKGFLYGGAIWLASSMFKNRK